MSIARNLANLIGNINAGGGGVNRNIVINGAMNVAQRGTSVTGIGASEVYATVDRFAIAPSLTDGRLTATQDSSAPSGFANSLKLDCTTADTSIASAEILTIQHKIEGQNLQAFAKGTSDAKPFAVSFYVKGNASATYVCELFDADNSRQISKSFNVTTDWTRVELSFPADTTGTFDDDNANSLFFVIWLTAGSQYTSGTRNSSSWAANTTANRVGSGTTSFLDSTDRTFFLTGVQLEVGQNPTEFEHQKFSQTLQQCQRYFQKTNAHFHMAGRGTGTTTAIASCPLVVPLRASPTTLSDHNEKFRAYHASAMDIGDGTVPTVSSFMAGANTLSMNMLGFDNLVDDRIINFQFFATANGTTGFTLDSEL